MSIWSPDRSLQSRFSFQYDDNNGTTAAAVAAAEEAIFKAASNDNDSTTSDDDDSSYSDYSYNDADNAYAPPRRVFSFDEWDHPEDDDDEEAEPEQVDLQKPTITVRPLVFRFDEWGQTEVEEENLETNDEKSKHYSSSMFLKKNTSSGYDYSTMSLDRFDSDLTVQQGNNYSASRLETTLTTSSTITSTASFRDTLSQSRQAFQGFSSASSSSRGGAFRPVFTRFGEKLAPLDTTVSTARNTTMSSFSTTASTTFVDNTMTNNNNYYLSAASFEGSTTLQVPVEAPYCESIPRRDPPPSDEEQDDLLLHFLRGNSTDGKAKNSNKNKSPSSSSLTIQCKNDDHDDSSKNTTTSSHRIVDMIPLSIQFNRQQQGQKDNHDDDDEDDELSRAWSSPTNSVSSIPEFILVHEQVESLALIPGYLGPGGVEIVVTRGETKETSLSLPLSPIKKLSPFSGCWRKKVSKSFSQILCKSKKGKGSSDVYDHSHHALCEF